MPLTVVQKVLARSPNASKNSDRRVKKCNRRSVIFSFFKMFLLFLKNLASNPPLRIMHARISNNLNKEFIMMTKFTIHVQHSRQIIVLVSVQLEFAEQSRFLCRVPVDFGLRLLSMVPLSKSFHNVLIFLLQ